MELDWSVNSWLKVRMVFVCAMQRTIQLPMPSLIWGADVALKAAITPTNVAWAADALYRELVRERLEFLQAAAKK